MNQKQAAEPTPGRAGKPTDAWVILLPPGWARFPTGEGLQRELNDAIEQVVARALPESLPRDKAEPYRHMLRDELHKILGEAREAGTGAVYLPTEPMEGVHIPASIAEVEVVSDAGTDPARIVTSILSDGYEESELVELDGRPGIRVVHTEHGMKRDDDWPELSTRQVLYAVSRDEADGEWLVLSFSTVWNSENTERLAEALVFFFDAVMTTFRWAGPGTNILNLPETSVPGSA
ncbi:hypothetical protein L1785_08640 [Antribacter sp. KLBMP9083]|uniref:Uncharacterized protein n=1 Tax=Antribacter soli TaxID=2910976 RepID=A0AA41U6H5_9MICO|nr:hypothetical protein [Antribacter soli]MCF4121048.1 hypothetical protein [Antribacter soli]